MQTTCIITLTRYTLSMENTYIILLCGLLISLVSISGVVILNLHPRIAYFVERNLLYLSAASAGVFLVTSTLLMSETFEILSVPQSLIAFGMGAVLYLLLHHTLSPHRHMGKHHVHAHDEKKAGWKIIIGDTLHNIADGLLLVASFGSSVALGISNALSIALHETPQEISEFIVLKKSGFTNTEAIYRNLASALSIFIGIAIGMLFIRTAVLQAYLLGITATFFLGIVFTDLFPIKRLLKSGKFIKIFSALCIGIVFMTLVQSSLGHEHDRDVSSYEHEEESHEHYNHH